MGIFDKFKLDATAIDKTIAAKDPFKPGQGIGLQDSTLSVLINENSEKTSDGEPILYFEDNKLMLNHIKDQIDHQLSDICIGGEVRDSKDYIEYGIAFNEKKIVDQFLYTAYGTYPKYPVIDVSTQADGSTGGEGIATVEDTVKYVEDRFEKFYDSLNDRLCTDLSNKADSDNVDQTIRAEFLGAYGFTLFDLEGRSRSVLLEHESFDGIHYVNLSAEDRSGYVKLTMPQNGETKTLAYNEDMIQQFNYLTNRIEELENQIKELKENK